MTETNNQHVMKQVLTTLLLLTVFSLSMNADRIITYSYDESGNRTGRTSSEETETSVPESANEQVTQEQTGDKIETL